jgi:hypothetical protein
VAKRIVTAEQKARNLARQRERRALATEEDKARLRAQKREYDKEYYRDPVRRETARLKARQTYHNPEAEKQRRQDRAKGVHYFKYVFNTYGLTEVDWWSMFIDQDMKCAICSCEEPVDKVKQWCVDHCHNTGKVRGILCRACNVGIGNLGDDPNVLRAAVGYLERQRDSQEGSE